MSFKHFFKTCLTENEIKENFKTINESRWWGKFKEDSVSLLEVKTKEGKIKKYKVCKLDEDGNGPAYVLEARNGARYGLFRATEGKFHCIRMKSGKKNLIKTKEGIFKEVDGKLVFELHTLDERRATAEPDKSMPNGEPTFDKNTDEWNKGVYTDAKA